MVNECDHYTYRVTWSEEDQEYAGLCTEFPSLSWLDEIPGNALAGVRKLVKNAVADMAASNGEHPDPISTRNFSGKLVVRTTRSSSDAGASGS
ncbi:toxin-antitoxin system HicB family antitoxin [Endozoicomonas sp. Mp262]|uniref:toxin-antitoxin system HicB family antitoxin n=1 Tax=Endozoicomonas sp. Mp262 TaxID=2919499 RepID=UPI0021D99AB9